MMGAISARGEEAKDDDGKNGVATTTATGQNAVL